MLLTRLAVSFTFLLTLVCSSGVVTGIEKLFEDHGNWCGGPHGGFYDCCDGKPCSDCIKGQSSPSAACLAQCPPKDAMDAACANHDFCCANSQLDLDSPEECAIQGNPCQCDCGLIRAAKAVEKAGSSNLAEKMYAGEIVAVFTGITSCRQSSKCFSPPHSYSSNCLSDPKDEL